jgi:uncharacterized damage-inducible protein DinB
MLNQIRKLVQHMEWADTRVLGALRAAPQLSVPVELFGHVLGAEQVWLARLENRKSAVAVWPGLTIDQCAAVSAESAAGYKRLVAGLTEADLDGEIEYTNSAGDGFRSTRGDILLQVMMHGSYHRGQIAASLRAGGAEPAPTDYIAFARGAPAAVTRRS